MRIRNLTGPPRRDEFATARRRRAAARRPGVETLEGRTLLNAGGLDPTFGRDGTVTTDFPGATGAEAYSVAVDAQGRVLLAGTVLSGDDSLSVVVARYHPGGTLDLSFGNHGELITALTQQAAPYPPFNTGPQVAVQPDGKIVVAASAEGQHSDDIGLERFNPDGTVDTAFGNNGVVDDNITLYASDGRGGTYPVYSYDYVTSVKLQPDGKVLVGGGVNNLQYTDDMFVARFHTDGTPDSGFGGAGAGNPGVSVLHFPDGPTTFGPNPSWSDVHALALAPDGTIAAVGRSSIQYDPNLGAGGSLDWAVALFRPDGTLDTSFNGTGFLTHDFHPGQFSISYARAVVFQPDGRLVVAGDAATFPNSPLALMRFNPDGTADTSFGNGGAVTTDLGGFAFGQALVLQPDGRLVVAGGRNAFTTGEAVVLARYDSDGTLDTSFGSGGTVTTDIVVGGADSAFALTRLADGKLVAAGTAGLPGSTFVGSNNTAPSDFALARYNADGSLDTSFGTGGTTTTAFLGPNRDLADDAVVLPDNKTLVVGGSVGLDGSALALTRYNADGSLDTSFGDGGRVRDLLTDPASGALLSVTGQSVAVQPDGKYVVAADAVLPNFGGYQVLLARFNPDGSLDATFGQGGYELNGSAREAASVALQPDGKIVVSATFDFYLASFQVLRFNADGSPDAGFGQGGVADLSALGSPALGPKGLAVLPDGDIVAAGSVGSGGNGFLVVELRPDGSPDTRFGAGGAATAVTSAGGRASGLAVGPDGAIVLVGTSFGRYVSQDFATLTNLTLARFHPDGSLDDTFGTHGVVTTSFGPLVSSQGNAVAIEPDGKIVAAGQVDSPLTQGGAFPTSSTMGVARYTADGALDKTFGHGGEATVGFGPSSFSLASAVAFTPDGNIVVAGTNDQGTDPTATIPPQGSADFAVARLEGLDLTLSTPVAAVSGRPAQLVAKFLSPGNTALVTVTWNFGDGTTLTTTATRPGTTFITKHTYARPGTYTVRVTIAFPGGGSITEHERLTVSSPPADSSPAPASAPAFDGGARPPTAAPAAFRTPAPAPSRASAPRPAPTLAGFVADRAIADGDVFAGVARGRGTRAPALS